MPIPNVGQFKQGVVMRTMLGLFLVLVIAVTGCAAGSDSENDLPVGDAGNAESGTFTDDAGDTMQFGPGTELPEDWPAALPVPPGTLLSVAVRQDSSALATWIVPDDSAEAIVNAYLVDLQEAGFSTPVQSEMSVPDEGVFSYDLTNDDYDVTVSAVLVPGESEITLIATARTPDAA
jgi:hypothetical protein